MSSEKTQHYDLHRWKPEDSFLRTEFNENFGKLDTALNTQQTEANAALDTLDAALRAEQTARHNEIVQSAGTLNTAIADQRAELSGRMDTLNAALGAERTDRHNEIVQSAANLNAALSAQHTELSGAIGALNTVAAGKCAVAVGAYVGNGSRDTLAQFINLGRRPKAVIVWDECRRTMESLYAPMHGMGVEGHGGAGIEIVDQGFLAYLVTDAQGAYYPNLNNQGITYMYIAFF